MIDIPVHLIQSLHERQQCLQDELENIAALRTQEDALKAELDRLQVFLQTYPVLAPAACSDETPPTEAPPDAPPTVHECVESILAAHGPSRLTYLQRQLRETYGLDVASSSLWDILQQGRESGRYVQAKQLWQLASVDRQETAEEHAG